MQKLMVSFCRKLSHLSNNLHKPWDFFNGVMAVLFEKQITSAQCVSSALICFLNALNRHGGIV